MFAAEVRKPRTASRQGSPEWRWHLDEVFVRINGVTHYLWRAVDHEGEVLEAVATKQRDRRAALKFLRKVLRRYGWPEQVVTDRLASCRAALRSLGLGRRHIYHGRRVNNGAENSHQPFRRRERAMLRFRRLPTLQKFAAVPGTIHNHFNQQRHLTSRRTYKINRTAALAARHMLLG